MTIKKYVSALLATIMASTSILSGQVAFAAQGDPMWDVSLSSGFRPAIEKVVNAGIMTLYQDKRFAPKEDIVREKAARFITAFLKNSSVSVDSTKNTAFSDIADTNFYAPYINSLANAGIMKGANGSFGYGRKISRAEFITILSRATALARGEKVADYASGASVPSYKFGDVPSNSGFFNFISYAVDNGLISKNETFDQSRPVNKEEAAAMISRAMSKVAEKLASDINVEVPSTNETPTTTPVTPTTSAFYSGDKVFVKADVSKLVLSSDKKKLTLTFPATQFGGKLPYVAKKDVKLYVDTTDTVSTVSVSDVTLVSKNDAEISYGLVLSDAIAPKTYVAVVYQDAKFAIAGKVAVTADAVTTPKTDTATSGTGSLDIVLDPAFKSDSVPTTQAVPFLSFAIKNGSSSTVGIDSMTFKKTGLGDRNNLENVTVVSDEVQLANGRTIQSDDTIVVQFSQRFNIEAGKTANFQLRATVKSGSSASSTYAFQIEKATSFVGQNLSFSSSTVFPLVGPAMTTVATEVGNIVVRKGDVVDTVNVGDSNKVVAAFFVDNSSDKTLYIKNFKLTNGGTFSTKYLTGLKVVDTVASKDVSAKITVIRDDIFVVIDGDGIMLGRGATGNFELHANIDGDKDRNIAIYMKDSASLGAYYNGFGRPYQARVNITGYDADSGDHSTITVNGGAITFTAGDDVTTDISAGATSVVLGKFNITSNDQKINLTQIALRLQGSVGVTNITDDSSYSTNYTAWASKLNTIRIVDLDNSNAVVSDIKDPSTTTRDQTFNLNDLNVGGNDSSDKKVRHLAILANLSSTAPADSSYTMTVLTTVGSNGLEGTTVLDGDDILQSSISPSTSISLNARTVKAGALTVQVSGSAYNSTIIKNSKAVKLVSFLLKAPSTGDVKLKSLKITAIDANSPASNVSTVANTFQNVALYDGDTVYTNAKDLVATSASLATVQFTGIDKTISANTEKLLTVVADVTSNATSADDFYFQINAASDVVATDKNSLSVSVTDGNGVWDNPINTLYKNTVQAKGVVTVSSNASTPASSLLYIKATPDYFPAYRANIAVNNENAKISKLSFKFGASTSEDGKKNLDNAKLLINGVDSGITSSFSSSGVTFTFAEANRIAFNKDQATSVELQVRSKGSSNSDLVRGGVVQFELDSSADALEFYGVQSKEKLTYSVDSSRPLAGSGNTFKYYYSVPSFATGVTYGTDAIAAADQVLLAAKVKVNGNYNLYLESIALKKTGGATLTNVRAYVSNGTSISTNDTDRVTDSGDYVSFSSTSETKALKLKKGSTSGKLLEAGKDYVITIVGDLNNTFKGNSISLSIDPTTNTGIFVWHDNDYTNTNSDSDNAFVEGLPLSKSWTNTQTADSASSAPTITGFTFRDTDTNGTIDTVRVAFSGTVTGNAPESFRVKSGSDYFRPTAMAISGTGASTIADLTTWKQWNSVTSTWDNVSATSDKYLANQTGGTYTIYYTQDGDALRDVNGNLVAKILEASAVSVTDAAAPVLLSAQVASEVGSNGIFDANSTEVLKLTFSEAMATSTNTNTKGGLEADVAGGSSFVAVGNTIINDDVFANTTLASVAPLTNNVVLITADGTNTASSAKIVGGTSKIRIKASQSGIVGADSLSAVGSTAGVTVSN